MPKTHQFTERLRIRPNPDSDNERDRHSAMRAQSNPDSKSSVIGASQNEP